MMIRVADAEDLPDILELLENCGLPTDDIDEEEIEFLVAVDGHQLAGVAGLERLGQELGLLRSVAVAANARGLEVANRLCAELLAEADEDGLSEVYLLTLNAADYFAQLGFTTVARERVPQPVRDTAEFSQLCPNDAVVMCRCI